MVPNNYKFELHVGDLVVYGWFVPGPKNSNGRRQLQKTYFFDRIKEIKENGSILVHPVGDLRQYSTSDFVEKVSSVQEAEEIIFLRKLEQ